MTEDTWHHVQFAMQTYALGAALGILVAMDYRYRLEKSMDRVMDFGLPRIGNPVFADDVDKRLYNKVYYVVNGHDWVPHMPPRELDLQHPSGQIWMNPPKSTHWAFYA
ncbi:putative secretory lipase (family 3) [Malassezia pachydermatis]|uniref:Putative secretory lipase (Family 3) n=1 Tax=Malassezia pachydermatis TaxID=77020 RepID=A0A0M8MX49_9BASI|nr:putative secretory lipase (family 3) [Malassezia pachydermatis]KOS16074.1 putative secretory lipase (family 3) [Malassezia pachydermatis]